MVRVCSRASCGISKSQIRNSKQIQNEERQNTVNVPNKIDRIPRFGFFDFEISLVWVCFGFGASDFGFCLSGNFDGIEVGLLKMNIRKSLEEN